MENRTEDILIANCRLKLEIEIEFEHRQTWDCKVDEHTGEQIEVLTDERMIPNIKLNRTELYKSFDENNYVLTPEQFQQRWKYLEKNVESVIRQDIYRLYQCEGNLADGDIGVYVPDLDKRITKIINREKRLLRRRLRESNLKGGKAASNLASEKEEFEKRCFDAFAQIQSSDKSNITADKVADILYPKNGHPRNELNNKLKKFNLKISNLKRNFYGPNLSRVGVVISSHEPTTLEVTPFPYKTDKNE